MGQWREYYGYNCSAITSQCSRCALEMRLRRNKFKPGVHGNMWAVALQRRASCKHGLVGFLPFVDFFSRCVCVSLSKKKYIYTQTHLMNPWKWFTLVNYFEVMLTWHEIPKSGRMKKIKVKQKLGNKQPASISGHAAVLSHDFLFYFETLLSPHHNHLPNCCLRLLVASSCSPPPICISPFLSVCVHHGSNWFCRIKFKGPAWHYAILWYRITKRM